MLTELFYRKVKGGYEAYDLQNHIARGATKELARNQFFILYEKDNTLKSNNIDINQFHVEKIL